MSSLLQWCSMFLVAFLSTMIGVSRCLTSDELDMFQPVSRDLVDFNTGLTGKCEAWDNGDGTQSVYSNGVPSHYDYIFPDIPSHNPYPVIPQDILMTFYEEPIMREEPLRCLPLSYIGIALSGTPIFPWFPELEGCPFANEAEMYDICEAHTDSRGLYHYHGISPCIEVPTCNEPYGLFGVAIDGIPIYGPIDDDGRQLANEDLDECGGKYDSEGRYRYHITVDPPYTMRCLQGEITSALVSEDPSRFICSCPYDDRMFKDPSQEMPDPICVYSIDDGTIPANCTDQIDTSYDIGYNWETVEREIHMMPCCMEGEYCSMSCKQVQCMGDSCVSDTNIKPLCELEERVVNAWIRVESNTTETKSDSSSCSGCGCSATVELD